jgi:hypothetical protein
VGFDQDPAAIGDEELTAEALAAEPDPPIGDGAVPLQWSTDGERGEPGLLPEWYMPGRVARVRGRARRWLVGGIVVGLLVINGVGLCVTYGFPEIAW